jgi:hypothetical protein
VLGVLPVLGDPGVVVEADDGVGVVVWLDPFRSKRM